MDLARLQRNWTNLGKKDPLWAILSDPECAGRRLDLAAFLQTGRDFIAWIERHIAGLGVAVQTGKALDFGCGYGRLTQALAARFEQVTGVDIAASMIEGARSIDATAGRCTFVHNEAADLLQFEQHSFDFVLTAIVLQHMRPDYAKAYLAEFLRVLRPGGVLFFQLSSEPIVAPQVAVTSAAAIATDQDQAVFSGALAVRPTQIVIGQGEWRWCRAEIHNTGPQPLRCSGPVRAQIAMRWQAIDGVPMGVPSLFDLDHDIAPGQSGSVLVPVRGPVHAGSMVAAFELTTGGHWREGTNFGGARVVALVVQRSTSADNCGDTPPPKPSGPRHKQVDTGREEAAIEVYGVPVDEVVATLEAGGGEVVDVSEDNWSGQGWLSLHYTVVKR